MLLGKVAFIVVPHSDQSVQLGIAEPAGMHICKSPVFEDRQALRSALERVGLSGNIAAEFGFSEPRRVNFVQLTRLGFF